VRHAIAEKGRAAVTARPVFAMKDGVVVRRSAVR
jgi:hypothetical protein